MTAGSKPARKSADDAKERRPLRAVRGIVFMSRLFEYECRDLGVSMAQYRMLLYLRHAPRRASELAQQASITRPTLSTLISTLQKQGWIKREGVDNDRRGVSLVLTRKGFATIERVERRFVAVFEDSIRDLDRERLLDTLAELTRVLNDQVAARARAID